MFTGMLVLHLIGAIVSIFALIYGGIAAFTQKGSLKNLKTTLVSLTLYQTVTGVGLVALQPTTATLTTFCIGGVSLFAVFAGVYHAATQRLAPKASP